MSRSLPAPVTPISTVYGDGALLQRKANCACGGGCLSCEKQSDNLKVQTKLAISTRGDRFEREADEVADQVMRMPEPMSQRQCKGCADASAPNPNYEEFQIKRQANGAGGTREVASDFTSRLGAGAPLDTASRSYFEARFGHDFGNVRIHNGPQADTAAASIQARAFTFGRDVVFAAGEHGLGSESGKRLLAHELTHVVQQSGSGIHVGCKRGLQRMYPTKYLSPIYRPAPLIQREEKINKADVRLLDVRTQISAADIASLAGQKLKVSGDAYDMVSSSGSTDAAFTALVERIAIIVASQFKESNFLSVLALDFSAVDWTKAGVKDAATKKKFGAGLHAFELIRWDGGKKLQLRMKYLREITEITPADSSAKTKAGKTRFAAGSFSFKSPTTDEKRAGYKEWAASEQDIVYMAVSRVPDAMLSHPYVKGIEFYRVKETTQKGRSAEYDQSKHRMEVADKTFEVAKGGKTTTLSSPADLYTQNTGIAGDAASGFTSLSEYTIIHEISHAMDWGPIRKEVMDLAAATGRASVAFDEMKRIVEQYKKAKDDAERKKLEQQLTAPFVKAKGDKEAAEKDIARLLQVLKGKTTLSGSTYEEQANQEVNQVNPPAQTDFEKAIAGKTPVTPYAATNTDEAFGEGLAQYIVNPGLLKEYRPELHAYFKKLLPP